MLFFVEAAAGFADKDFAVPALTFTFEQELEWLQAVYTERVAKVGMVGQQISLCIL